ncbi:hypothetical protein HYPBUDRAFT_164339 [Hyphopichia burtonii NRRL Y-1933]|uniref:Uncharacterized protein n=1 Tax=Hyphopichia burtonii NRRL Y-1933 TaxID=984485 RepID=A0A1E4RR89_9ASCO|nr:hypothetical protein HYPBUDRAFT_164339 [Hyphopichia burtonii NRRL Y-1933]ODV69736.1 hypothetical protein HYPBUDRAFT_164339 [Hyphopichia burtonii NRRL Y-1933]
MSLYRVNSRQLIRIGQLTRSRCLSTGNRLFAKNDESTIDSYRLPSQTSINEWEFKYDFIPKVAEPKIPPITPEAVKQDIAHERKARVEKEMFNQEGASSVKVEGNDAKVMRGGEFVQDEPEYLHDRELKPVDVSSGIHANKPTKPANRDRYVQSSLNPEINQSDFVSLGDNQVDHKVSSTNGQAQVIEDIEHDEIESGKTKQSHDDHQPKPNGNGGILALVGIGSAVGGYYYFTKPEKK